MRLLIRVLRSYKHSNNILSHKKCVAFALNLNCITYMRLHRYRQPFPDISKTDTVRWLHVQEKVIQNRFPYDILRYPRNCRDSVRSVHLLKRY